MSSRKKIIGFWVFAGAAMAVAIVLAVFVAPWASSSPDGLEKTAIDKGFAEKAEQADPAWTHSPMSEYDVPGVEGKKSTGLSGLLGVLITAAVMVVLGFLVGGYSILKKRRSREQKTSEA